jgi:hypothetical protein
MFVYYYLIFKNYLMALMTPQFYVLLAHYWEKPDRLARILLSLSLNFNTYFYFFIVIMQGLRLRRIARLNENQLREQWNDLFPDLINDSFSSAGLQITTIAASNKSEAINFIYYNSLFSYFNLKKIYASQHYKKLLKYLEISRKNLKFDEQFSLFKENNEIGFVAQINFLVELDKSFREFQFFSSELENLKIEILTFEILYYYFSINNISDKQQLNLALDIKNSKNSVLSQKYCKVVLENFVFYRLKF